MGDEVRVLPVSRFLLHHVVCGHLVFRKCLNANYAIFIFTEYLFTEYLVASYTSTADSGFCTLVSV